ncbi:hypothetical protein PV326_003926 [Microctonus aethiopoides]|nr:hypothetical protein PV326_003926 [Microctonus aethiopoides]
MAESKEDKKIDVERPVVAKTATDLQRLKLLKLMKNPDKPLQLPERPKLKNTPLVPEFVRNVMGSSAGAGSGEFHVYRHLRRKEYARQKFIQEKSKKELLDIEYRRKIEENKLLSEQLTAKKRAKRLKKKQNQKKARLEKKANAVNKNEENKDNSQKVDDDSDKTEDNSSSSESDEKPKQSS